MEPEVRYCTTTDGVNIAYTVAGLGPPVLWCIDQLISHVQLEWSHPVGRRILSEASRRNTLVRFDFRGCGLSDRVMGLTVDDYLLDMDAVVARVGLDRLAIFGLQTASPCAIAYAARHPEKVDRLVLQDGFARYSDVLKSPQVQALLAAAKMDWVTATEAIGYVAFGAGRDENKTHGEYVRACVGPEYFDYVERFGSLDASEATKAIKTPTLLLRHSGLQFVPPETNNHLAARIPDAQVVVIEGSGADDVEETARRITAFINSDRHMVQPDTEAQLATATHGTATIVFADIADSTALTERMGDTAFRDASRALDADLRLAIRAAGGAAIEGKLLGDGVLATFPSASQAIDAALAFERAAEAVGVQLHVGIHAGDVIREGNDVFGGAVNIASRISSLAVPGEVLVSRTVADLARTSAGVKFEDRGEHALKGVADAVRVYAVHAGAQR